MSLQTQVILSGHLSLGEIKTLLQAKGISVVSCRHSTSPDHVAIDACIPSIGLVTIDVFLNSMVAEDYKAVFDGPSTLLSMPYFPGLATLVAGLAGTDGRFRRHDMLDWPTPSIAST